MELLDRIAAALATDAPTSELTELLREAGGETCWRRPRLIHRLTAILHAKRPVMSKSTTHRFKPEFAARIKAGLASGPEINGHIITPDALTDELAAQFPQYGYGHLLEVVPASGPEAEAHQLDQQIADLQAKRAALQVSATPAEAHSGLLLTAVEQTDDKTIVKHSSGGPDDLPITAPIAEQEKVVTPNKLSDEEAHPTKQPKEDKNGKKDDKHK